MSEIAFLLENASWPAFLVDSSGVIRRANSAAVDLLGPALESKSALLASIWAPENNVTAEIFLTRTFRATTARAPIKFRTKNGANSELDTFLCLCSRDDQKYLLFQLLSASPKASLDLTQAQKQKLDCALQLARTVALDFNNALTSILGHTSLILSKMNPTHPWRTSLVEVEKSASKAAEIAHDLASFSLQEKDTRAQTAGNLNHLLRRTIELFQNSASRQILWTAELENRLFSTTFDEAKMQQAFIKILDNAVQAVSSDGRIKITTHNLPVPDSFQDGAIRLAAGNYVCVEFSDNGCGIPPEILPRIFEPFFTTKKGPNHRGLGLAWVYGIVTNHGGSVAVSSQPALGTNVRLYLPAQQKIVRDLNLHGDDLSGSQTILLIDDEDLLLTMGETVLSSYGYRVLTANNGQKALDIFAQSSDTIDLVITDLVMPKMSGRELIERLRRLSPTVKIISSSGYVRSVTPQDEEFYLQKPFTSQDLLRKVKQVLAQ